MAVHIGNASYPIYEDDTEKVLLGHVQPGAEFVALDLNRVEVGRGWSIDEAAQHLSKGE